MQKAIVSFIIGLAVTLAVTSWAFRADHGVLSKATDVDKLVLQARGEAVYWDKYDQPIGYFHSWKYRHYESTSRIAALNRLAELGPAASDAVPLLIELLRQGKNDYDTGDGILMDRSAIAMALGMIGDDRAIEPLIEKLEVSERYSMSSYRANFTRGRKRQMGAGHEAIAAALGMFGAKASAALPLLKTINEDPNSMAANSPGVLQAIEAISTNTAPDFPAIRCW